MDAAGDRQRRAATTASSLQMLDAWRAGGSKRLDADGDNVYEHSRRRRPDGRLVAAVRHAPSSEPALGKELVRDGRATGCSASATSAGTGRTQVQKDLRSVLGRPEQGRYSRIYCGGPRPQPSTAAGFQQARAACRQVLLSTLAAAYNEVAAKQGSPGPSQWKVFATCDDPLDLRPDRPQHRRRRRHPALPVAEPRHLPPDRGDHRAPLEGRAGHRSAADRAGLGEGVGPRQGQLDGTRQPPSCAGIL